MDYIEFQVEFSKVYPWRDVLISKLDELGFESFVETKSGLNSYIPENNFKQEEIKFIEAIEDVESIAWKVIKDQNWNAKWEENFDPVFVEDKLVIKAPFHTQEFDQKMQVTIQPQMSFGTGHHQTTWLISKRCFDLDLKGKTVLDMGTGTGVLAILADKLGAAQVFAPDIDEWSFNNALENVELNACKNIEVALGDDKLLEGKNFDILIANINKNILIQHFSVYSNCLKVGGKMLISGFFATDANDLIEEASKHGFIFEETFTKDEWAMMQFSK
ncbi:MAG: 50S ribosomal protein L11 methyltransferase [Crocinitomicaceae bacterium]